MKQPISSVVARFGVLSLVLLVAAGVAATRSSDDPADDFRISGDPVVGEKLFVRSCAPCHGADGSGSGTVRLPDVEMPDLRDRLTMTSHTDWQIYEIIVAGGEKTGRCEKMLPAGHRFDENALQDLAAYVKQLPAKGYVDRARSD
jgi:mono/diheme cytochrome c family protein